MHQLTPTVSLESLGVWLSLAGFGIYHGLNPAMGWLFALARGLQQDTTRAIWLALIPIALGHAASIALAAGAVVALHEVLSLDVLEWVTAGLLIGFGVYKLVNWYRHPRWVGMRVKWHELAGWSFLMATAHGAGLMAAPALLGIMTVEHSSHMHHASSSNVWLGVGLHTLAMLLTMAVIAWVVYWKLGLKVLRQGWVNFDLIWSVALIAVGGIALVAAA